MSWGTDTCTEKCKQCKQPCQACVQWRKTVQLSVYPHQRDEKSIPNFKKGAMKWVKEKLPMQPAG